MKGGRWKPHAELETPAELDNVTDVRKLIARTVAEARAGKFRDKGGQLRDLTGLYRCLLEAFGQEQNVKLGLPGTGPLVVIERDYGENETSAPTQSPDDEAASAEMRATLDAGRNNGEWPDELPTKACAPCDTDLAASMLNEADEKPPEPPPAKWHPLRRRMETDSTEAA